MNLLIWVFCLSMWGYVAGKVGRRIIENRTRRNHAENLREFGNLVARDCHAGARIPDAVRAASDTLDTLGASRVAARMRTASCIQELGGCVDTPLADSVAVGMHGEDEDRFLHLWALSTTHGISLGTLADIFVRDIDAQLTHTNKSSSAMAGARLTVLVLLGMPVGAVFLGQTMGLGTMGFYTQSILGALFMLVGSVLGCVGVLWTETLTATVLGGVGRRAGPSGPHRDSLGTPLEAARILDVVAASLRAGAPLAQAWDIGSKSPSQPHGDPIPTSAVQTVSAQLHLGAGRAAWTELAVDPHFGPIARLAAQQATSGAMLANSMEEHSRYLRKLSIDKATEGAEKMLVVLAAPLTLCFLPAFVLTGLVPLAIGLAGFS